MSEGSTSETCEVTEGVAGPAAVTLHVAGPLEGEQLNEVAELFVQVDATFGDRLWWTAVRRDGIRGAHQKLALDWWRTAVARGPAGELVGFAGLVPAATRPGWALSRVMVHPGWQRQGVATAVCRALLDEAAGSPVSLDVMARSWGAVRMYHRLGFHPCGVSQLDMPGFECLVMVRPPCGR